MKIETPIKLLTLSELARLANQPTTRIQRIVESGEIQPAFVTARQKLFRESDVARLAALASRLPGAGAVL